VRTDSSSPVVDAPGIRPADPGAATGPAPVALGTGALLSLLVVLVGVGWGPTAALFATAAAAVAVAFGHSLRADDRTARDDERAQVLALSAANRVLVAVGDLARSLPGNLDLDEVLVAIEDLLRTRFGATRLSVLTLDDGRWYPQLVQGFDLGGADVLDELPAPLAWALDAPGVLRVDDLSSCGRPGSGLYARLIVEGMEEGLVAIEHPEVGHFDDHAVELFDGLSEVVALSIDNARAFGRLRSLAAAEERARIARDLHDRLGQWLTYISLELERFSGTLVPPSAELERLQGDVRAAIAELRDALVELRTTIQSERPLAVVLPEVIDRFRERTGLAVELNVPVDPRARLNGVAENELLRIVQESLTNIEKHADANSVHVSWSVEGGRGMLTIEDNGRGFDPGRGVRSTAYGLVGMRERAAAVGAILEISSQNGVGTVVTVLIGTTEETRP
jgi:signal transduction histidine kinase